MIDNKTSVSNEQKTTTATNAVSSPISRSYKGKETKTNAILAWLKDTETVEEGKISAKAALASYAKGLLEMVKVIYRKPVISALAITLGIVLTVTAQLATFPVVMGLSAAAGAAGFAYGLKTIITKTSTHSALQGYELLGISTLIAAIGIYGLIL